MRWEQLARRVEREAKGDGQMSKSTQHTIEYRQEHTGRTETSTVDMDFDALVAHCRALSDGMLRGCDGYVALFNAAGYELGRIAARSGIAGTPGIEENGVFAPGSTLLGCLPDLLAAPERPQYAADYDETRGL